MYPVKETPFLSVPADDNGNHIADQWEKENGIYNKNYAADWDEEDVPSGWKTKGDGLSLFEEYRGFLIEPQESSDEKFQRLMPGKRKLFLYGFGADKPMYKTGAQLFTKWAVVDTYFLHYATRMKPYGGQEYPRWINFNKTPYTVMSQCGVYICDYDSSTASPGYTANIYDENDEANQALNQCPQTVKRINCEPASDYRPDCGLAKCFTATSPYSRRSELL